ncbi:hypothetical protein EV182_002150 [Spiromyces aspiralis]|uniref:Uncharacterized protein n=1 Tax=Spiromyces aspiralis TaxID=68401 RepID=A0ACC1HWB2_9FUNG|nr:hypothetical protein EV182_002150 [Spiromyces aspiralis]
MSWTAALRGLSSVAESSGALRLTRFSACCQTQHHLHRHFSSILHSDRFPATAMREIALAPAQSAGLTGGMGERKLTTSAFVTALGCRQIHTSLTGLKSVNEAIEEITDLATLARDEMEFAEEARNTVYYNEEKANAQKASATFLLSCLAAESTVFMVIFRPTCPDDAIDQITSTYDSLRRELKPEEFQELERRVGMKVKEIIAAWEVMAQMDLE